MTSIYLVRHGQTAWNKEEIFRGRTDVPLDETGLKQAELAGEYFKGMEIHGIYSSSLSRAWETAQKIAEFHDLKVQPLQGIIDIKRPLPAIFHKRKLCHQKGIGPGSFPQKAARYMLKVIANAENNAEYKGFNPEDMKTLESAIINRGK